MRQTPILLDTCAAIWTTEEGGFSAEIERIIADADTTETRVLVSPITAWEVGLLVSRGRLALAEDPKAWFGGLLESGVELAPLTPEILVESSFLPSCPLRDPADRIVAATARAHGYRLMTRDRAVLNYGRAGWLKTIAC